MGARDKARELALLALALLVASGVFAYLSGEVAQERVTFFPIWMGAMSVVFAFVAVVLGIGSIVHGGEE